MVEVSRASLSLESSSESESELSAIIGDQDLCKTTCSIKRRSCFSQMIYSILLCHIGEWQNPRRAGIYTHVTSFHILVRITLAPFSTMKISLEYRNYSIFVLALKDLVSGIYGLFFYAGTNQNGFLLVA